MEKIEKLYCTKISLLHRKKFAQFFTPRKVADFMISWLLKNGTHKEITDPAFGLGVFYDSLRMQNPNISFRAYEIDKIIYNYVKNKKSDSGLKIVNTDYLTQWSSLKSSAIICNPPYLKFHHLKNKLHLYDKLNQQLKIELRRTANLASVFLAKSIAELKSEGVLAYLMPLEFLATSYGVEIKSLLLDEGHIESIIKFENEKEIFSDVATSVGLILFRKTQIKQKKETRFYNLKSINDLDHWPLVEPINSIQQVNLKAKDKWLHLFEKNHLKLKLQYLQTFKSYGGFKRGIATGANDYFLLSQSQIKQLKLPSVSYDFCISKSQQIKKKIVKKSDLLNLAKRDQKIFLLDLSQAQKHQSVMEYLKMGVQKKINERYLTRHRTPWYKVEERPAFPLLIGVFSRNGYKVIRNKSKARTLSCFHGLSANKIGLKYVDWIYFYLISDAGQKILKLNSRRYAQKLDKFEPQDLNSAYVPTIEWFNQNKIDIKKEYQNIEKKGKLTAKTNKLFLKLID